MDRSKLVFAKFLGMMHTQLTRCSGLRDLVVLNTIKHLNLPVTPQILLQLIEANILEKISLDQLVNNAISGDFEPDAANH